MGVEDTYGFVGQLSPVLLMVLGVAAEYYPVHCFTRYAPAFPHSGRYCVSKCCTWTPTLCAV